jgi:hypothetical protein
MKRFFSSIKAVIICILALICGALAFLGFFIAKKTGFFKTRAKKALGNTNGEGFVDTAIKILMAVVIGALVLAGLYALFNTTVIPTLVQRVTEMFNYKGA